MPKNGGWLNGPFVDTGEYDQVQTEKGEKENES